MSQSFVSTNSFTLELGQGSPPARVWVESYPAVRVHPLEDYFRFLRYPRPGDGWGYRAMRLGMIGVLRLQALHLPFLGR